MTREEFRVLFEQALDLAARNAEAKLNRTIPREFVVEFHGLAPHMRHLTPNEAFEDLYLGEDRFFRVIDVSVIRVSEFVTTVFVCVSGHEPSAFEQTWNQPTGSGPFKQVLTSHIKQVSDNRTE